MSNEAVTQRLRLLGELWELCVSLKKAKPADFDSASKAGESSSQRDSEDDGDIDHI